ncbi:hypothetical protein M406DRAFT_330169 [Cryphonectria parasitica EP155]|uniref:Uncharacterized protein n=1 Tax=Cryphonectria parasitica (strain ATCC 38755 / EP155) TaxID=660469 RepID=A0A9P5CQL5_CRYP1|nr:uncharacterized protein M406DRAFT_330169 [Cryphonectria parasitica EP155]KAF3766341.1 hypothetical protein M406DRAFT_330169 [Cryphonectria parasitica EP155]
MDTIVSMVVNRSTVTVEHINIKKATPDSLTMSLVNRVTGTGPTSATMSPMVVDLVFGGVAWGKLQLPEVVTSPSGTDIVCAEQEVAITDQKAFRAFVKALTWDEELRLTLDNGDCRITTKIMGFQVNSNIVYSKELLIKGMGGPKVSLVRTGGGQNTVRVENPSPLEIDHGVSMFEVVVVDGNGNGNGNGKGDGVVAARLRGGLIIVRGACECTMDITFTGVKVAPGTKARLIGRGTEAQSWMNDTLQYIDSELEVTEQFAALTG